MLFWIAKYYVSLRNNKLQQFLLNIRLKKTRLKIERIKDLIQSCHINFLLCSLISKHYLTVLGNIEKFTADLSKQKELKKEK